VESRGKGWGYRSLKSDAVFRLLLTVSGIQRSSLKTGPVRPGNINFVIGGEKDSKIVALAMMTQRRQTYASHVNFHSVVMFMCLFLSQKILKVSLQSELKEATVWPFNACSKVTIHAESVIYDLIIAPVL